MEINAKTLRDLLSNVPRTLEEIETKTGKLPRPITTYAKDIRPIMIDGEKHYTLASALPQGDDRTVTPKKKAAKRPRRLEGFKARKRKLREITRRLRDPKPDVKAIALDNLVAQAEALGAVVEAQVDDINDCPPLKIAIANLNRAKALYAAA